MKTILAAEEGAILERAISADNETWSPEVARAILAFRLANTDLRRADVLAVKARKGSITDEEKQMLENYLHVGRMVEFMKAKALLSLNAKDAAA